MSVWSEQYQVVTREPIQRVVELAVRHREVLGLPSQAFLDGDQAPHDVTIDELDQAANLLSGQGIRIQVTLGGMMGPSLLITHFHQLSV